MVEQNGPASAWLRSRTLMSSRGSFMKSGSEPDSPWSFDHLVRPKPNRFRNLDAERACGLQVEPHAKGARTLDGHLPGLGTHQNPVHLVCTAEELPLDIRKVRDQSACLRVLKVRVHGRKL